MANFELDLCRVAFSWNGREGWWYHETLSLDSNNFRQPIMGHSGNGKTTFLKLIAGLKWPDAGTITWRLPDDTEWSWKESGKMTTARGGWSDLRKKFGFAFQDSTLMPYLTVRENLLYPLKLNGLAGRKAADKVTETLKSMLIPEREDLGGMLKKFPGNLSGGQKKRVALAQAMIRDPVVLFADEPTGSLDAATAKEVRDCVIRWLDADKGRRAFVWVTHYPNDPADYGAAAPHEIPSATEDWRSRGGSTSSYPGQLA